MMHLLLSSLSITIRTLFAWRRGVEDEVSDVGYKCLEDVGEDHLGNTDVILMRKRVVGRITLLGPLGYSAVMVHISKWVIEVFLREVGAVMTSVCISYGKDGC